MTPAELESQLRAVLDAPESWSPDALAGRLDFDLNPEIRRVTRPLRPAAVLVPIVPRDDGVKVLMTRRSDSLASHTGQVAFPGGRLDPGEGPVEAALREAWEEIALDPGRVRPLGLSDTYETGTGFLVTPVVAMVDPPFEVTPNLDEVADVFEVPWDFLMDTANHRQESLHWKGAERFFWAMPYGERYIWGATAGMIRALHARLHDRAEDAA